MTWPGHGMQPPAEGTIDDGSGARYPVLQDSLFEQINLPLLWLAKQSMVYGGLPFAGSPLGADADLLRPLALLPCGDIPHSIPSGWELL